MFGSSEGIESSVCSACPVARPVLTEVFLLGKGVGLCMFSNVG